MAESGFNLSFYIQSGLTVEINEAVRKYPGTYKSRSHFINCAISRQLRWIKEQPPEVLIE
jgi:Arc/MetJ-type ribon-helix-helix transcriptional regulator